MKAEHAHLDGARALFCLLACVCFVFRPSRGCTRCTAPIAWRPTTRGGRNGAPRRAAKQGLGLDERANRSGWISELSNCKPWYENVGGIGGIGLLMKPDYCRFFRRRGADSPDDVWGHDKFHERERERERACLAPKSI